MSYDLPYTCNWKKKKKEDTQHNNNKLIDTEDRLGIARCGDAEWEK